MTPPPFTIRPWWGAPPDIAQIRKSENRALITLDLDFSNIRAQPPSEHPGIIVLRTPHHDKQTILALVSRVIPVLAKDPLRRAPWLAEPDRVRTWRRAASTPVTSSH